MAQDRRIRIVGPGRAGRSFALALARVGWSVDVLDRHGDLAGAGDEVEAVLLCVPDGRIAGVAADIEPSDAAVLHCSGVTSLAALAPHQRVGSIHPLMALPDPEIGAARLLDQGWYAVAGDPLAQDLVRALGGRGFAVADEDRARYHATAAIAANHLVALLAQVERLAAELAIPVDAFLDLAQGSFDDVRSVGALHALTGPASRRDGGTLDAHRQALPADETTLYEALSAAAAKLGDLRRG
ncbi:MAG: DUF2520 domain-containing protein [Actinomycetota bacterium]